MIDALGSTVEDVDPARADAVLARIATQYRIESADGRATIDAAVDAVEWGLEPGELSRRPLQDRVEILRAGVTGQENRARDIPGHESSMRSRLVENALGLVAVQFLDGEIEWHPDLFLLAA